MPKKESKIVFCLIAFTFQTVIFNGFLSFLIVEAKMEAAEDLKDLKQVTLTQQQYDKLQWLNEDEFVFGTYLVDVKESRRSLNKVTVLYKVDLKETGLVEKLIEHYKHNKNKKIPSYLSICKVTEPYVINFIAHPSALKYQKVFVPICTPQQDKHYLPPKA